MQVLDLIGIFAFAVSGALMAIRRDFDLVGIAILAVVMLRDVGSGQDREAAADADAADEPGRGAVRHESAGAALALPEA